MAQGPIPEGMHVDHICHNRACGKLEHLRLVTRKQNAENRAGADRNTQTGIRGVTVQRRTGKFIAQVTHDNKWYYAGLHLTAEAAGEAARLKRLELFTHNEADRKAA